MAAKIGNNYSKKLKTDELKAEAYRQYCQHISEGYNKKSWCFEHPELTLTWESMEKYIKESEQDFDPIKKKIAESKGLRYWDSLIRDSASGRNAKANTATIQMVMRNKYGWDKVENRQDDNVSEVLIAQERLMIQLTTAQKELGAKAPNA